MTTPLASDRPVAGDATELRARTAGGSPDDARFWPAVIALAMGGFAIGTTEFVTMGVLPQVADGVGVSIPVAGHLISAYALGVVVGAPVIAYFGAKLPRRALLLGLMAAFAVVNAGSALAPGYASLLGLRFLAGLPHGAFFGVAALVAQSLVGPERRGRAVSLVMMGIPAANLLGVPAATWLGQHAGWRASYLTVAVLGALAVGLVLAFVPDCPGNPEATGRRELQALREPQLWFAVLAGAVGFGGMFALFSYVAPTVTRAGGLSDGAVPVFLLVMGLGMVAGNWAGGLLIDWSLQRTLLIAPFGMAAALALAWVLVPWGWISLVGYFVVPASGSLLALGLMLRLIDAAGQAETLGAAMSHASLNIGNALGAWAGGLTIAAGYGYRSPLVVGVALALAGFVVLAAAVRSADRSGDHSPASRS